MGSIICRVKKQTGALAVRAAPLPGVAVTAIALTGERSTWSITDRDGTYRIALPPGEYDVEFSYGNRHERRSHIRVVADHATPVFQDIYVPLPWNGVPNCADVSELDRVGACFP